jgi:Aerotolerance regulator N-terminal
MDSLTFLNPMLLWGLALASIPLIIHLLFRRKFRRVEWAPMKYLKLSIQRNRQRIRLEQLLLLLLRTFAILLLFFLVARPLLHASGLGSWLSGRSRASRILLVDDSLSMGYLDQGHSALERAQDLAVAVTRSVGAQDRFTLLAASQPKTPLVHEVELADPEETIKLVRGLKATDSYASWETVLAEVDKLLETATYPIRELTIVTDLRRAGWDHDLAELGNRWAADRVQVRLFDVGSQGTENVEVVELNQVDSVALVGNPMRWEATVRNGTTRDLEGSDANFFVDGKPSLIRLPSIPPGESGRVPLMTTFQDAGPHHVAFTLAPDPLHGDDNIAAVLRVIDNLHVVLVDGEPSSEPLAGEVDFLALAFSLGASDADSFRVEVIPEGQWDWLTTSRPHLIVLANVASLTPAVADRLTKLVESGVGLMIFPGDQVDPDNYNQVLFHQGSGLMPGGIESVEDQELAGLVLDGEATGPLAALGQLNPAVLSRIKVRKFLRLSLPADGKNVRVLARWNDPSASPAAIEKLVGKGHILLWTVTADKNWSDWPSDPSYVLAMREAAKSLVRDDGREHTLIAGEAIRRPVAATHDISQAEVEKPGAERPVPLAIEVSGPKQNPPTKTLVDTDTRLAGLYRLRWNDAQAGPGTDLVAVNADVRESALERITNDQLRQKWGATSPEIITIGSAGDAPIAVEGQEIWRNLALGLMGLLIAEAGFATFAGRQR